MSIIKPRTRGKHVVEHRTRLDRENHETLHAYAAFLDEDTDYVLNQLIESVLEKDREFATWRVDHKASYAPPRVVKTVGATRPGVSSTAPRRGSDDPLTIGRAERVVAASSHA